MAMILYSYFRSSASFRVRIALNLKGIPFEYRAVHLLKDGGQQHDPEFLKLNPSGEVPVLVDGDRALSQSLAIFQYLDQIHPQPRLFAAEPYLAAQTLQLCEVINSGVQPLQNLRVLQALQRDFSATEEQKQQWAQAWIKRGFAVLEKELQPFQGPFAMGPKVSAVDACLIPQAVTARRFKVELSDYPKLQSVFDHCMKLEAFDRARPERQPDYEAS